MAKRLGEICVSLHMTNEETITKALSQQLKLPFLEVIPLERVDVELVSRVPIGFAKHSQLLPLWQNDGIVTVATTDPLDYSTIDELQLIYDQPVHIVLVSPQTALSAINQVYEQTAHHHAVHAMENIQEEESLDHLAHQIDKPRDLLDADDDAPIIRLVNSMLFQGVKQRASDIHVESYEDELVVRYRIDGILYPILSLPAHLNLSILSRIKILAALDIAEKRLPQDGRFGIMIAGRSVDIRVSVIPTSYGERAAFSGFLKNIRRRWILARSVFLGTY